MNLSCIITDDEPLARRGIQGYVEKIPVLSLKGICQDVSELNILLQQQRVDLLFLDIEMPGLSGLDFLRSHSNPPKVILTTAYEQYALQAFDLDVLDYLLKPISFERFLKAVNKAADYYTGLNQPGQPFLFVKVNGIFEKIMFAGIICIEALENYVAIHTIGKKILVHLPLKSMLEQMPSTFIQCHKSWIVNTGQITAVGTNSVACGDRNVPMSRQHRENIMNQVIAANVLKKKG